MTDMITNPPHYQCENVTITVEPIQLCEQCGFLLGNALKYLFRYPHKGKPLEDLKKAEFYLKRWLDNQNNFDVELRGFNDEHLVFKAFKHKEFFAQWDTAANLVDNIEVLLAWTQNKIENLEEETKK